MKRKVSKSLAALMLGALVFMQASVVLAFCDADAPVLAQAVKHSSDDCCQPPAQGGAMNANVCVAHCTSDFQTIGLPAVLLAGPSLLIFVLPRVDRSAEVTAWLRHAPPSAVPRRILFQTLLI